MNKDQSNTSHPRKSAIEEGIYAGDQNALRMYAKNQIDALKSELPRLVESLVNEKVKKEKQYVLPEFNPDISNNDPHTWYKLVDIHLAEQNLSGRELFIVISKALKGSALRWLSHLPYSRMTWPELKRIFKSRYCSETTAAAIIKFRRSKPAEGVSLATYASEIATGLTTALEGLTTEQIVTAMVLAQVSTYDERLHRIALTTDISSLVDMQRELEAVPLMRTQPQKRMRLNTTITPMTNTTTTTTHTTTTTTTTHTTTTTTTTNPTTTATSNATNNARRNLIDLINVLEAETVINVPVSHRVTCFKCWSDGHYEWDCPQIAGTSDNQGLTSGRIRAVSSTANQRRDDSISNSHLEERISYRPANEDDSN